MFVSKPLFRETGALNGGRSVLEMDTTSLQAAGVWAKKFLV